MKKYFLVFVIWMTAGAAVAGLPEDYLGYSPLEKQTYLWDEKIEPAQWDPLPPIGGGGWSSILGHRRS